jgi:hypothetical protein
MEQVEQFANQYAIEGVPGAISMEATKLPDDNMSFSVECHSFSPAYVQLDETGAHNPMTEYSPPSGDTAGTYLDTVTFDSIGEHDIICFNGITRVSQDVFAGEFPAYDPRKYQATPDQIHSRERDKAAKILVTTGTLNG